MKTAISIPDPLFEAAEEMARRKGVSRSELYARAIAAYVEAHRDEDVTAALNRLYNEEESSLDPVVKQLQAISLSQDEW